MNATAWKLGDKHPDAPWTKDGVPFTCPVCDGLSAQRLGWQAIVAHLDLKAYCPDHFTLAEAAHG